MEFVNCEKIHSRRPWSYTYMYMDLGDEKYLADPLFSNHNLHVTFVKEFAHPDTPYFAIICRFPKKELDAFLECMDQLKHNMLVLGHTDYENICNHVFGALLKNKEQK